MNEWMNECFMTPQHKNKSAGVWLNINSFIFAQICWLSNNEQRIKKQVFSFN